MSRRTLRTEKDEKSLLITFRVNHQISSSVESNICHLVRRQAMGMITLLENNS